MFIFNILFTADSKIKLLYFDNNLGVYAKQGLPVLTFRNRKPATKIDIQP